MVLMKGMPRGENVSLSLRSVRLAISVEAKASCPCCRQAALRPFSAGLVAERMMGVTLPTAGTVQRAASRSCLVRLPRRVAAGESS